MDIFIDISELLWRIAEIERQLVDALGIGGAAVAAEMEASAKQNAPWTDRTGRARSTMTGFTQWENEDTLLIGVSGHMSYSPLLELYYGERFAILMPTVEHYLPNIVQAVANAALALGGIVLE